MSFITVPVLSLAVKRKFVFLCFFNCLFLKIFTISSIFQLYLYRKIFVLLECPLFKFFFFFALNFSFSFISFNFLIASLVSAVILSSFFFLFFFFSTLLFSSCLKSYFFLNLFHFFLFNLFFFHSTCFQTNFPYSIVFPSLLLKSVFLPIKKSQEIFVSRKKFWYLMTSPIV